jgi:hypothetical protein
MLQIHLHPDFMSQRLTNLPLTDGVNKVLVLKMLDWNTCRWAISNTVHLFWCWDCSWKFEKGTDHQVLLKSWQNVIKIGGNILCSKIQKLINCIWNKDELPQLSRESILQQFIKGVIKWTAVISEGYHCYVSTTHKILSNILLLRITPYKSLRREVSYSIHKTG